MSETSILDPVIVNACAIAAACASATGTAGIPADATARHVRAASKEYSARGSRRHHWYRMVLRNGAFEYFADRPLERANFRASERRDTVRGYVYDGEILVQHDHGGPVDAAYLVVHHVDEDGDEVPVVECKLARVRTGLRVTLPNGVEIDVPNPRK